MTERLCSTCGRELEIPYLAPMFITHPYYEDTREAFANLLLKGHIRLGDIPFLARANTSVYAAAIRVSRNDHNMFIEDVQIIMDDVLLLAENPDHELHKTEFKWIVYRLMRELEMYDFDDGFVETIYTPFVRALEEKVGSIRDLCGF